MQARCGASQHTCRKCAEQHPSWECEASDSKCANGGKNHVAGHVTCAVRQREEKLIEIQQSEKVGKRRDRVLLDEDPCLIPEEKHKYFSIIFKDEQRKKMCPFKLKKALKKKYNIQKEHIATTRTALVVKAKDDQGANIMEMTSINGSRVTVEPHKRYNSCKGIIYLRDYSCEDEEAFRRVLQNASNNRGDFSALD